MVENSRVFNANELEGYQGTYTTTIDSIDYQLVLQLKGTSFEGNIDVSKNGNAIETCTFYRAPRQSDAIPGFRTSTNCKRGEDEVNGGFSFDIDHRTLIMNIYAVSGSLDLAIPNNINLRKEITIQRKK